jgi:endo-1,4-beta-D-glucanase Y
MLLGTIACSSSSGSKTGGNGGDSKGSVSNGGASGSTGSGSNGGGGGSRASGGGGAAGNKSGGGAGGATSTGTAGTSGGGSGSGGSTATSTATGPTNWINSKGIAPVNTFGIQGNWYAFGDGSTSTQTGNPYRDSKYCVKGTASGDGDSSAHWGAGIGLDLNYADSTKKPYQYDGKITGFKIKFTGTVPTTPRVQFVSSTDGGVSPFVQASMDKSVTYAIADAKVPFDWNVANAGKGVEGGVLYSIQVLVDGAATAGAIDLCIAEFEPMYDPNAGGGSQGGAFINSDGFTASSSNTFGIQGPAYTMSDGTSTTQTGNPWQSGKYCVSGTFTGSKDNWGAGIAFDLNRPAGGSRAAFKWKGKVGGFRIKLTGDTPGKARVQFVITEPPDGNQPFVMALPNTTTVYRIKWAQVPTSWDVSDKGTEVSDSLYTVQIYLEGDKAGPFKICVEDFTPLADDQLATNAQSAATGYSGARTVSDTILAQEYKYWKANRLRDCGDGSACVPTDDNNCISEGIGYGMLIAVGYDDQSTFDKIWAYYKKHNKTSSGLMTWKTSVCGSETATGTATDGDLDAAMALVQAGCKWGGSYKNDANTLISAIKKNAVTNCSGKTVLQPGAGFGGCNETNPSYFAVGYFKAFASLSSDSGWTTLANDSYSLLSTLQGKMSGQVPDWTDSSGTPESGDRGKFGPDASRTPWRVATDYVWNNEAKAVTFLNNFSKYVESNGGVSRLFTPNSNFRGGSGLSGLPQASAKAQEYTDAWLQTSVDDTTYFPGTLRLVYMLLAANKFPKGCN